MNTRTGTEERCRRVSCKFYNRARKSACNALAIAYEDDQKCKFYKPKKEEDV